MKAAQLKTLSPGKRSSKYIRTSGALARFHLPATGGVVPGLSRVIVKVILFAGAAARIICQVGAGRIVDHRTWSVHVSIIPLMHQGYGGPVPSHIVIMTLKRRCASKVVSWH